MAMITSAHSNAQIQVNYSFNFAVSNNIRMAEGIVVLSNTVTHDGDTWQLETAKGFDGNYYFSCRLHLVTSSTTKKKVVRMCHFANGQILSSSQTAVFCHSGDKSDPEEFDIINATDEKIIVEVLQTLEVTGTAIIPTEPPTSSMASEVLNWFQSEDFGDVTIVAADGTKFRCHRDILARRSEVFRLMFSSGMKEARENLVTIDGYSGDVVAQLLVFLYTNECEVGPIANRLYSAAHQYEVDRLKVLCKSALTTNLSAQSVVKTYRLAKFYHIDDLLAICVDYLDTHKAEMSTADLLAEAMGLGEENKGQMEQM